MNELYDESDTGDKSLFRGVRASKFRHVFGSAARKDQCYDNINITKNAHDSNFCAVNPKFLAIVTESCGGGSFLVIPIDKVGRVDVHAGRVTGHKGQIFDIKWNPFNDNVIASCSDDTTIKLWYIPDEGLLSRHMNQPVVDLREHKRRVSFVEWHPTVDNILVSAGADHLLIVWNTSRAEMVRIIDCHHEAIHSLSFNRSGSLLATTSKDKRIRIIDPRSGKVVNEGLCHHGTKASKVVYLGDSQKLFTVGFSRYSDRQWAVWSEVDLSAPLTIENIDSSSGVLFPFYDHDTRMVYVAGKGDGNIRYYETTDEAPYCHYLSQYLSGLPQRGLGVMTKRGCNVYKCEVFRFYKLHATRPMCEPISMIVPRKSEQFQADIFPNTAAPTAALTAEQWLSGENRNPILFSLKTGAGAKTNKPVFVKPPTANGQRKAADFEAKLEFISQAKQIDYREKCLPSPKCIDEGTGSDDSNEMNVNDLVKSNPIRTVRSKSNAKSNGNRSESLVASQFVEAVHKTNNSTSRNRLPWVKKMCDDEDDDGVDGVDCDQRSNPMCDIVSMKHMPEATYVTINDDSDDSLATTDDSITDEMALSNGEYDNHATNRADFNLDNTPNNHSPNSNDSMTDKTSFNSDLFESNLTINPKNERELWYAFQEQRALIYKLRAELKEKD
ncbi:hypothetical protein BLOT_000369 [Blomia tropicalis]|nr:hypothetical protein BLOT_000369 [Blomia tropicalis]